METEVRKVKEDIRKEIYISKHPFCDQNHQTVS